jgi:branched-chain amino acid transport system substrate-binding protein
MMRMGIRTLKSAALALAVAFAAPQAMAQEVIGVTDDEILIGALGVLTGPLFRNGKTTYDGVETVYNEVNAAGGIHGRKLRYVREDDVCKPDQAVPAVKKLIYDHKVFLIHGGGCSNASLAAKPEIEKAGVPWVITASTAPQLTDPVNPMIFTTMLAGWMETAGQLQRVIDLGAKKIAIVAQHDAWGESRYTPLLDAFKAKGMEPVADEELSPEATDATPVALQLQAAGADAIITVLFPKAAAALLRDMYKIGYKPIVVGGSAIGDIKGLNDAIGIDGALAKFQSLFPTKSPLDPSEDVQKWKAAVAKYYPDDEFMVWHMFGIASGQFMVKALEDAGRDLTREKIAKVLATTSVPDPDTYAGPIACTPEDHQCYKSMAWFALKDGEQVQVGETHLSQ